MKRTKKKTSFVVYTTWRSYFELLEDPVLMKELLYAMFDLAEGKEVNMENYKVRTAYEAISGVMEKDIAIYQEKCEKSRLAAEKRWGKKNANAMRTHLNAIRTDGDNDNVNEYDNENDSEYDNDDDIDTVIAKPRQGTTLINVQDVIQEARKQGFELPIEEAENFINYYFVERKGMINDHPIRNWKNLIKGWYRHIYVNPRDVLGEGSTLFNSLPEDLQNKIFREQEVTAYDITKGTADQIRDYLSAKEVV